MSDSARCPHDVTEREVAAVADGLCPLCLSEQTTALWTLVEELAEYDCVSNKPFSNPVCGLCTHCRAKVIVAEMKNHR